METPPLSVAVTGAAGYIGLRLVQRLLAEGVVRRVVGIDTRPAPIAHPKLTYLRQDINAPLGAAFRDAQVDTLVHLAFILRQLRSRAESYRVNVQGMANVLRACTWADVRHLVLMSSHSVYGPNKNNAAPFTETSPLRPPAQFHYAVDKVASEDLCRRHIEAHPHVRLTTLRGCVVMGPNAANFITKALDRPVLPGIHGSDPEWQFLHEDDLVEVLMECMSKARHGIYNVAGKGGVRWSEIASIAGRRLVRLPAPLLYGLTAAAWQLRLQNDAPSIGLDFIRWPWKVGTEKLDRGFDHHLQYTSREALESYITERRIPGRVVHR